MTTTSAMNWKYQIVIIAIIRLAFALAGYFYPQMPERMTSHWNAQGQVEANPSLEL